MRGRGKDSSWGGDQRRSGAAAVTPAGHLEQNRHQHLPACAQERQEPAAAAPTLPAWESIKLPAGWRGARSVFLSLESFITRTGEII